MCQCGIFDLLATYLLSFFYSDYLFKLLLIGDSGVGKSCLLLRFAVSNFQFEIVVSSNLYLRSS